MTEVKNLTVISGESFFRLKDRTRFADLVNGLNGSSVISFFEVWNLDSNFVFRIWSATTSRLSLLGKTLSGFEIVHLSCEFPSSLIDHLRCCCFRSDKPTEINGFVAEIENESLDDDACPNRDPQSGMVKEKQGGKEEKEEEE